MGRLAVDHGGPDPTGNRVADARDPYASGFLTEVDGELELDIRALRTTYNKTDVRKAWPLVTVAMVTYPTPENGRLQMLDRALKSLEGNAAGGFDDFEVFIVDDGSPLQDEVYEKAKEWGKYMWDTYEVSVNFKPIKRNTGSQGYGFNLTAAVCNGSVMTYLDDDNEWDPDHLNKLASVCQRPGVDLAYSGWRVEADGETALPPFYVENNTNVFTSMEYSPGMLNSRGPLHNFIDGNSIAHSKAAAVVGVLWTTGKLWDTTNGDFNDWEFLSRWERNGVRIAFVKDILTTMHFHKSNRSHKASTNPKKAGTVVGVAAKGMEAWRAARQSCWELVFMVKNSNERETPTNTEESNPT